jgi:hypothetical protein
MDPDSETTDSAFLDIAANLLAIILIMTVFSLAAARHHTHSSTHPAARPQPAVRFIEPQRDLFPPFSSFFFVTGDRVVPWDQAAVLAALQNAPRALTGTTAQGRYEWLPEPLVTRDIDTFQLKFFVDRAAVLAAEPALTDTQAQILIARLIHDEQTSRTAPVFIVYPDGMETFVRLYALLQDRGLRFRWFARNADEPLFLGRHPGQFTDHAIYW